MTDTFERLWARTDVRGPDDCWEWQGARITAGYGQIVVFGKRIGTHRVAWESQNGPVPDGLIILHSCDNPPCCNPAHLRPGTVRENAAEASERGRLHRAERNGYGKLTVAQVAEIRARYASGEKSHVVAGDFGISPGYVRGLGRSSRRDRPNG